ncbi:MAG TPA: capsular biosynthesis protein [Flavobacteriales bacterium]|nr:capsular biosynthesis protein [Flavobacteriales bacterium]|tara:strand:+ start:46863 stop:48083 length:1221 start_codon:yes stop_codon:yes gene_type:complete
MIPFSPPKIYQEIIDEVADTLKSGWITTGPKTKLLEQKIEEYIGALKVLCVNSATAGLELMLRWYGVKEGDEVIIPAYTYCATANVVRHCGATPVMVDVNEHDFNINIEKIKHAITSKTKAIIPVDFAGFPADYDEIMQLVKSEQIKQHFVPENENQHKLNRIFVLSDAAHSFGANYKKQKTGTLCDATVFSFHAVKNFTTAEGGAIALNLPQPFANTEIYKYLNIISLHGQSKDALAKTQAGAWQYDVIEAGYKANMTDILASLGLVEIKYYEKETLPKRKAIFRFYTEKLNEQQWATLPPYETETKESSYHLYPLRIKGISEQQRNAIIKQIAENGVSVNVHFQPLPLLSYYKNLGYNIEDYPVAYKNYAHEISLPVYYDLTNEQMQKVIDTVIDVVNNVLKNA